MTSEAKIAERICGEFNLPQRAVDFIAEQLSNFGRAQYERGQAEESQYTEERLGAVNEHIRKETWKEAIEKAAEVLTAFPCECEITLDQDGLEHIIEENAKKILALLPKEGAK